MYSNEHNPLLVAPRDLSIKLLRIQALDHGGFQVNRIPVVHGSALFQLGSTQSLATATVGSPDDEQRMQGLLDADSRRLIVHFAFPPYAPTNVRRFALRTVWVGNTGGCFTFADAAAACCTGLPRSNKPITRKVELKYTLAAFYGRL